MADTSAPSVAPSPSPSLIKDHTASVFGDKDGPALADGVDEEPRSGNERRFHGIWIYALAGLGIVFSLFHLLSLNAYPLETWNFRLIHIAGALSLGFILFSGTSFRTEARSVLSDPFIWVAAALAIPALVALGTAVWFMIQIDGGKPWNGVDQGIKWNETWLFGVPLLVSVAGATVVGWLHKTADRRISGADGVLIIASAGVCVYLVTIFGTPIRQSTGTSFAPIGISFAAIAGTALILEMTRRVAGLALVIITAVFLAYTFLGPLAPQGTILNYNGLPWNTFFSNLYTDAGILGPTTAVSSTYIILFIIFAAFLQASKVGDYFVNFAFAAAGWARGGPAKVGIFASGLMGMINGTSAGNVVATGSLTIPLMKRVGYKPRDAGAVEAAASTGGQIMPPIMGAGAFIMAEITGIPYQDIAIAAIIPAVLYFVSVYFMVDFTAAKENMRGIPRSELPKLRAMARRAFLFLPILILIIALFMGYSVIRAGTLAMISAIVVSWLHPDIFVGKPRLGENAMGPLRVLEALRSGAMMSIQIIAVCACAGIIVGVISLTGVGGRFSNVLLDLAENNQLIALVFAMLISMLLGMGMPTTAAYAVAASVVAPGLIEMGIDRLTAHFFVFYYAVVSAITPPVALASYAAAGISGANPMATSVASFRIGLAAYIVPFMFFFAPAILMNDTWYLVILAGCTATVGVYLLSSGVVGWFLGAVAPWWMRIMLLAAALCFISGSLVTDAIGLALAGLAFAVRKFGVGLLIRGKAD